MSPPSPQHAERYERFGEVTAVQQSAEWAWIAPSGDELIGAAGDWLVSDVSGSWSVADAIFRATHSPLAGDRWVRTGDVVARRLSAPERVATLEGSVEAAAGDWIVTGPADDTWVVQDQDFTRKYRRRTIG